MKKTETFILEMDEGTRYAVLSMTEDEFEEALYNTEEDWKYILRTSQDYYEL